MRSLKRTLDRLYREFDFKERIRHDPVEFPHRYSDPGDIEIAGFIASCFAYGQVRSFKAIVEQILSPGGKHPAEFIKNCSLRELKKHIRGINYRFNKEEDIVAFLYMLSGTLKKHNSLKELFYMHDNPGSDDIRDGLSGFVNGFFSVNTEHVYRNNAKPPGLLQLLPSPENGSACKRANLFLRWMVRKNDIDFGIWDRVRPSRLIIPLDTHIAKISRCIGLTTRNSSDWKTAREITGSLKKLDPSDPLKYDFALCHHGISGRCKGRNHKDICLACAFL